MTKFLGKSDLTKCNSLSCYEKIIFLQEPALLDSTFYKQQSTCATLPCCTNLICILATSCDTPSTTQDSKLPQLENLKKWTGNVQILCCYSEVFTWVGCSTNSLKDFWPYLESSYNIQVVPIDNRIPSIPAPPSLTHFSSKISPDLPPLDSQIRKISDAYNGQQKVGSNEGNKNFR